MLVSMHNRLWRNWAQTLKNSRLEKSKYSSWIKMYSSKQYQQVAIENIHYLDVLFKNNKDKNENKLRKNFKKSTILERNFWESFV